MPDRSQYIQLVPGVDTPLGFESGYNNPQINRVSTITIRLSVLLFIATVARDAIEVFIQDETPADVANWIFGLFINLVMVWAGITGVKYKNPPCCCGCSRLHCYYFWNLINAFFLFLNIMLITGALIWHNNADDNQPLPAPAYYYDYGSTSMQVAEAIPVPILTLYLCLDLFFFGLTVAVVQGVRKMNSLLYLEASDLANAEIPQKNSGDDFEDLGQHGIQMDQMDHQGPGQIMVGSGAATQVPIAMPMEEEEDAAKPEPGLVEISLSGPPAYNDHANEDGFAYVQKEEDYVDVVGDEPEPPSF